MTTFVCYRGRSNADSRTEGRDEEPAGDLLIFFCSLTVSHFKASPRTNHGIAMLLQKNDLKEAADREMKAALQRVSSAGDSGVTESDNSSIAPLRTRLQQAIENMQEGLVERDTEVRSCCTLTSAAGKP